MDSWKVNAVAIGACNYRAVAVVPDNGRRCVTYEGHICWEAKGCNIVRTTDCLDADDHFFFRDEKSK